jgi:hypothetical protein
MDRSFEGHLVHIRYSAGRLTSRFSGPELALLAPAAERVR